MYDRAKRCSDITNQKEEIIMKWTVYVARDEDQSLFLYTKQPSKGNKEWFCDDCVFLNIPSEEFPEIKWEDARPTKATITISL